MTDYLFKDPTVIHVDSYGVNLIKKNSLEKRYESFELNDLEHYKSGAKNKDFVNSFLKYYFSRMAKESNVISCDSNKLSGMPVINGTRIPVTSVLGYLSDGETFEALQEDFNLTKEEISSSVEYVIELLGRPYEW